MSLRYAHTLISASSVFTPEPAQVQAFLTTMVALGVMGGEPGIVLRTPSARTREVRNSFTDEVIAVIPMKDHTTLQQLTEVSRAVTAFKDYDVEVSGTGRPQTPPVPLDFNDPYHVGVTCRLSSVLRSTSDLHEAPGGVQNQTFYGQPCSDVPVLGYFSNPRTGKTIEVPDAGCARFWVEFSLGNWLCPPFGDGLLDFLNPAIITEAQRVFGTRFVQGCTWG